MNRVELLEAAKCAAAVVSAASPLEILKCVLVEIEAEQKLLSITATNLEVSLRLNVPIIGEAISDTGFAINARLLFSMLNLLRGEHVEIERHGSKLVVSSGKASYQVSATAGKEYPRVDIPFPSDTVKVESLPSLVHQVAFATAVKKDMPLLRCVNLMFTSEGLRAVGSDGNCIVSVKGNRQSIGNISFLVPADSLEKLARLCEDDDVFSVGTTGKQIVFLKRNFAFSARLMDGNYINAEKIFDSLIESFSVLSDAAELRNAIRSVTTLSGDNRIVLSFAGETLRFACDGDCGASSVSVGVIPLTGEPIGEYTYTANRLEKCLRAMDGTLTLGMAQGGMLTVKTENVFYMQTPMRTAAKKKNDSGKQLPKAA